MPLSRSMRPSGLIAALTGTLLLTVPATAAPTTCDEAILELARRYGVEPVITADVGKRDADPATGLVQPADRYAVAGDLLGRAMAAARRDDQAECTAKLEEARAILASPMPGSVTAEGRDR